MNVTNSQNSMIQPIKQPIVQPKPEVPIDPTKIPEESKDQVREQSMVQVGKESTKSQAEAYMAGSSRENTVYENQQETQDSLNNYNNFMKDVKKAEGIQMYANLQIA